jgi:hypothetical protein
MDYLFEKLLHHTNIKRNWENGYITIPSCSIQDKYQPDSIMIERPWLAEMRRDYYYQAKPIGGKMYIVFMKPTTNSFTIESLKKENTNNGIVGDFNFVVAKYYEWLELSFIR